VGVTFGGNFTGWGLNVDVAEILRKSPAPGMGMRRLRCFGGYLTGEKKEGIKREKEGIKREK
jgi:hypothetical protein